MAVGQFRKDYLFAALLKLKWKHLLNSKFYMNGCKVSKRKSKENIRHFLPQKLQQSSHIPNPEILCASTQLCSTSSSLDITTLKNQPQPKPSKELCII